MKEKLALLVAAVFLLVLFIIELCAVVPNKPEGKYIYDDIDIEAQKNTSNQNFTLRLAANASLHIKLYGFTSLIVLSSCYRLEILAKNTDILYKTTACCCRYLNKKAKTNSPHNNIENYLKLRITNSEYILKFNKNKILTEFLRIVLKFMVAITFVKLVIIVFAYQQLLHNGYIIIQNLYHKHIKQFEKLICNRSYQLKSGHGLDVDENYLDQYQLPHLKHQKVQLLQQHHEKQVKNIVASDKYSSKSVIKEQYGSINNKNERKELSAVRISSYKHQLYYQDQLLADHNYYQQVDYEQNFQNSRYYQYYFNGKQNHCFYQMSKKPISQCTKKGACMKHENFDLDKNSGLPQQASWKYKRSKVPTTAFKSKMEREYSKRALNIPASQQTTPVIPLLASLSSTICCWKMTGSRKRRKRKCTFSREKYTRNCNYLILRSCLCSCCCCDDFCQTLSELSEYFFIHSYSRCDYSVICYCCCYCCYCELDSNASGTQMAAINHRFCKRNFNFSLNSTTLHKNSSSHQLNIIKISQDITSPSRQGTRNWYIDASDHGDNEMHNGNNLLRSPITTTSTVHNRSYKRKLKNNLVWLFIGLVWLEGPKLINCSISHNNNDGTGISGNETTNKIGSSQSSNNDNSAGSSDRNGGRSNEGSSNNTNGPGPAAAGPRSDNVESKGRNLKSGNLLKVANSIEHSANINTESYIKNRLNENTILIEHSQQTQKQHKLESFHQNNRNQRRKPYITSKTDHNPNQSNNGMLTLKPPLLETEEVNRVQSDLVRLESIKRQILTKLGLTEKPNVTHPLPKQFIWDTIYRADGIRSVSDFDFNDNHRAQEHMRLTAAVLEPPPLVPQHFPQIINSSSDIKDTNMNRLQINGLLKSNFNTEKNDVSSDKDMLSFSWKLLNLTTSQVKQREELSQYQRKHRQQHQQQRLRGSKDSSSQSRNRHSEPDYFEGDDFFGSTQEIITFAEKGKIYKKHRLVEFSPPSNKIPKQKLQIRNAEIHIRIEKVLPRPSITTGEFDQHKLPRQKYTTPREPNLKIWIFQLIGNDFSSKGFDQVATLCSSLTVDHNVLGWQKLDITETVQFWYGKHKKDKLRLLIDCTGCGNRYILHLFDRKFHHSLLSQSTKEVRAPYQGTEDNISFSKYNITALKPEQSAKNRTQRYYYRYRQYNHHRYRRKSRTSPAHYTTNGLNLSKNQNEQQSKDSYAPSFWLTTSKYRKIRTPNNPESHSHHDKLEGVSYEVGAEYHLEDRLNPNRPFLVLHTEPSRSRRVRRRAIDCSGAMHGQCCKESFYVSFKALGWDDWIIAPRGYFANYCRGDCTGPYRTPDTFQTFHAHFIEEYRKMGLLNGMQPCCAPVKFSSMSLIYYGDDGIIKRDLPKMVVDECGCP